MRTTTAPARTDREDVARIIAEFRSTMAELRCLGSERLVRLGISMTQLHVITMLERHGELPMTRLAELLDVSVSNATGLIDRMEERGVVERARVPGDRRVVIVRTTDRGREILGELEVLREDLLKDVIGRLDDTQIERVAGAMTDLREAVTAVVADDPRFAHEHGPRT
jgi:DNA-binding MarR family transcriptional regulator